MGVYTRVFGGMEANLRYSGQAKVEQSWSILTVNG